jgi:hypothetical protein
VSWPSNRAVPSNVTNSCSRTREICDVIIEGRRLRSPHRGQMARADGMKIVVTGASGFAVSVAATSAVVDKATPVVDPDAYAAIQWLGELMLKDAAVTRVWWSCGRIETGC